MVWQQIVFCVWALVMALTAIGTVNVPQPARRKPSTVVVNCVIWLLLVLLVLSIR